MVNAMVMFSFVEIPLSDKVDRENQNCQFKLKFRT